jgi:hypothetical protein
MNETTRFTLVAFSCSIACASTLAYEINNHADMSQVSGERSRLSVDVGNGINGKLFRLGLRQLPLSDPRQSFPLTTLAFGGNYPLDACFGVYYRQRPDGSYERIGSDEEGYNGAGAGFTSIPSGLAAGATVSMSIAQAFRWGACYEDATEPAARSLAHFYDVQGEGRGVAFPDAAPSIGPGSLQWVLSRNPSGPSGQVGVNHFIHRTDVNLTPNKNSS